MKEDGFTLIELCFITLILGLFATLAFPRLDRMLHYQSLSQINAQLLGFVRSVQRYAILSDTDTSLCLHEELPNQRWLLYSTTSSDCSLNLSIRKSQFSARHSLQVRRYTSSERRAINEPHLVTFYASSGRSSINYRLVFEDPALELHVGIRITNIGHLRLCASEQALFNYQGKEVLACQ